MRYALQFVLFLAGAFGVPLVLGWLFWRGGSADVWTTLFAFGATYYVGHYALSRVATLIEER